MGYTWNIMTRAYCRRDFLHTTAALAVSAGIPARALGAEDGGGLIAEIQRQVIFNGRRTRTTWFHPRPCRLPAEPHPAVLMTLQTISGSDVFGHVHWTESRDLGKTFSSPQPIPGLGRRTIEPGYEEGVCDVVPEHHPPTNTVLAIGHNVYYRNGALAQPQGPRWPVYVVRDAKGNWSAPARLEWDDPRATQIYTCGCGQRWTLDDGHVLIPLSFAPRGKTNRSVTTVRAWFDGRRLEIREVGSVLDHRAGRGLLEPSLVRFGPRYYLTLRAEDQRGYVSTSDDGLHWDKPEPWCFDDGQPLTMSTTQQHWVAHRDGLFLVYTRRDASNVNVFRWRAPLFIAQVDVASRRLRRDSEQVVLPLVGDGVGEARRVARMGNFHTLNVTPEESWVTVGETLPADGWAGDTLLARVRWTRPNGLLDR